MIENILTLETIGLIIFSLFLVYMTRSIDLSFSGQLLTIIGLISLSLYVTEDPIKVFVIFSVFGLGSIIDLSLSQSKRF